MREKNHQTHLLLLFLHIDLR